MSVIGYIVICDLCNAKMLVTADAKHGKFCPDCLDQYIAEAIEQAIEDSETDDPGDYIPPWQVHG